MNNVSVDLTCPLISAINAKKNTLVNLLLELGAFSSDLQFLIDNLPGHFDLFEVYAAQGLPLKGQILGFSIKRNPIDYVVFNFNDLSNKHGADTVRNLIRLLCKLGADINEYSGDGTCPLINAFEAFLAGKNDLIKLLLELGADANQYREFLERREEQERIEFEEWKRREAEERERRAEQERKEREQREFQEKQERKKLESAVKRERIKKLSVAVIVTASAVIATYFIVSYTRNSSLYGQAAEALSKGDYETAIANFQALGSFRDASTLFLYAQAEDAVLKGDFETAIKNFQTLGDFRNANTRLYQTTVIAGISEKLGITVSWRDVANDVLSNLIGTGNRHTGTLHPFR